VRGRLPGDRARPARGDRGRARAARGAVRDGRVRPGRAAARVAGRGGGGAGRSGAGGEGGERQHGPVPHHEPPGDGGGVGPAGKAALCGRERVALGAVRGVQGGRQQDLGGSRRGEPGAGPAGSGVAAPPGRGPRDRQGEAADGRLRREQSAQDTPGRPLKLDAYALPPLVKRHVGQPMKQNLLALMYTHTYTHMHLESRSYGRLFHSINDRDSHSCCQHVGTDQNCSTP
jgi:hypothetical protein